uniref:Selenocysteine lyase n=1 Tax=Dicentrarchus labrax TaxID=13489 RepID=A0A8C4HXP0_DICLA
MIDTDSNKPIQDIFTSLHKVRHKAKDFSLPRHTKESMSHSFSALESKILIYMDYNATTPLEPEVIETISEALQDAWGNPSSNYIAGAKAKAMINQSRENVARMVGGKAEDIIFTSGGTEANNLVLHTAVEHFRRSCRAAEQGEGHQNGSNGLPHIIASNVEHDSVKLVAEHLRRDGKADVTFVPVSKVTARVEVEDVIAEVRPNTCLISVMLANNETGVIMPVQEICQRVRSLNKQREQLRVLVHTDAAQALGKIRVDACELGVDYLTIVGHKFYAPRIGALYVNGPGTRTPLCPMLFGGGQERNFRPGHMRSTKLYLEERLKAVFIDKIHFNNHYPGSDILPNTCNVSILGPTLQGWRVLSNCTRLLASVGAACHSDSGNRPSHILLSCGVPSEVAANALRLSVGRGTTKADVDAVVEDLRDTVRLLEGMD